MECDGCTLCCHILDVPDLESPSYTDCRYCNDKGCSIYEKRPDGCRKFGCLYWHEKKLPESLRPDNLGVMVEMPYNSKIWASYVDPKNPDKWKTKEVFKFFRKIMDLGHPIVLGRKGKSNKYFVPDGWTVETVIEELKKSYDLRK